MSTWIAITDCLPPEGQAVLVWMLERCTMGYIDEDGNWYGTDGPLYGLAPSHWQALPVGPKETE